MKGARNSAADPCRLRLRWLNPDRPGTGKNGDELGTPGCHCASQPFNVSVCPKKSSNPLQTCQASTARCTDDTFLPSLTTSAIFCITPSLPHPFSLQHPNSSTCALSLLRASHLFANLTIPSRHSTFAFPRPLCPPHSYLPGANALRHDARQVLAAYGSTICLHKVHPSYHRTEMETLVCH